MGLQNTTTLTHSFNVTLLFCPTPLYLCLMFNGLACSQWGSQVTFFWPPVPLVQQIRALGWSLAVTDGVEVLKALFFNLISSRQAETTGPTGSQSDSQTRSSSFKKQESTQIWVWSLLIQIDISSVRPYTRLVSSQLEKRRQKFQLCNP